MLIYIARNNGINIDSHFYLNNSTPLNIVEKTGAGDIKHCFLGKFSPENPRYSVLTKPNGDMYGYNVSQNGDRTYWKYVNNGWKEVQGNQKYLEAMYKNNTYAARQAYSNLV